MIRCSSGYLDQKLKVYRDEGSAKLKRVSTGYGAMHQFFKQFFFLAEKKNRHSYSTSLRGGGRKTSTLLHYIENDDNLNDP